MLKSTGKDVLRERLKTELGTTRGQRFNDPMCMQVCMCKSESMSVCMYEWAEKEDPGINCMRMRLIWSSFM